MQKGTRSPLNNSFFVAEVVIILPRTNENLHEQLLAHPEATPKLQRILRCQQSNLTQA
jgi:hypothetical protein